MMQPWSRTSSDRGRRALAWLCEVRIKLFYEEGQGVQACSRDRVAGHSWSTSRWTPRGAFGVVCRCGSGGGAASAPAIQPPPSSIASSSPSFLSHIASSSPSFLSHIALCVRMRMHMHMRTRRVHMRMHMHVRAHMHIGHGGPLYTGTETNGHGRLGRLAAAVAARLRPTASAASRCCQTY